MPRSQRFSSALIVWLFFFLLAPPTVAAQGGPRPPLVVVISVDQLRDDRLGDDLPGGLGRLARDGLRFAGSRVDHAITETCPGHAVIMTGVHPAAAGIPGNSYVDRERWRRRYCVDAEEPDYRVLGGDESRSPWMLRTSGLAEWLALAGIATRLYALGGKDRSAIMLGGLRPNAVLWFAPELNAFTSSGYYMQALPDYVRDFNASLLQGLPPTWEHAPGTFRRDDFPGESEANGRVSGHPVAQGRDPGRQILQSPYVDQLTLDLAMKMIAQEGLGGGDGTDVLAVALSANDTVGHLYGPFSAEAEDALAQLDRAMGQFLDFLDARVGEGRYLVALTADHGVTPLPEYSQARGENRCPVAGGRITYLQIAMRVYGRIYWRFTAPWDLPTALVRIAGSQVYVNGDYLAEEGLDRAQVLGGLVNILEGVPGVRKAWTRAEIDRSLSEEARLLQRSLVSDRSGDIFVQLEPDCVLGATGTSHGMLYPSDRSVPLLFYGAGISPGEDRRAARSVDLAPTLARYLGIEPPPGLDGQALGIGPDRSGKP